MKEEDKGRALVCFIIAAGIILFFNLWSRSLENHGYLRYAEIAREMIRSGEWVVPHYNGEVFVDKPPLLFWLIAIPSYLYGSVTPFIARLPSALAAWIGVILLFFWAKEVYGTTESGLVAGGVLLSSHQYFFQSRLAKTDMVLCLFIILALFSFYLAYRETRERRRHFFVALFFLSMGLGTLTKGFFGLIPFLLAVAYLIKERRWKWLVSKEFVLGYVVLGLTTLPWIFSFIQRVGWEQTVILVRENRILSRTAPIYFYFLEIWAQFFPWSLLLPFLAVDLWKERGRGGSSGETFFLSWFLVLLIVLTLFKYRVSRYLLPVLPPLALMIGGMWKDKMWKLKMKPFLIVFFISVFLWHGWEAYWIKEDRSHSPGMVLVEELRPLMEGSTFIGYGLDESTVEEINFYLDRRTPILTVKGRESPCNRSDIKGKELVLMPGTVYEKTRKQGSPSWTFLMEFPYKGKKGNLVLANLECPSK